jgi:hypothetical protein
MQPRHSRETFTPVRPRYVYSKGDPPIVLILSMPIGKLGEPLAVRLLPDSVPDVDHVENRVPAAMAAGVVDTLMSFEQLFDRVMGEGYAMAA